MDFHSKPTEVMCPNCNVPITTRVEHEAGTLTWWLCCFVNIFVMTSFTSVQFVNSDWDVIVVHALQGS
uniref:LITAF domain-containing protein n=1 Tax=Acrobeloides nanus TaxID=290746 RepID=A0A914DYL6_9BILA